MKDLVLPNGETGLDALTKRLQRQADEAKGVRLLALQAVTAWLKTGVIDLASIGAVARKQVATVLLQHGQSGLLRHLLPHAGAWTLTVTTADAANTLQGMGSWPDPKARCTLIVSSGLPAQSIQHVTAFAKSVANGQLHLRIEVQHNDDRTVLPSLANLVKSQPQLYLSLHNRAQNHFPADQVREFLQKSDGAQIAAIELHGIHGDGAFVDTLAQTVFRSNAQRILMKDCSEAIATTVMEQRPWDRLGISVTEAVTKRFLDGAVTAKQLTLYVDIDTPDLEPHWPGLMIGSCNGLEEVTLRGMAVDVLAVAEGLDRNRSVHSVSGAVGAVGLTGAGEALALLRRNQSIRHLKLTQGRPEDVLGGAWEIAAQDMDALNKVAAHIRLRHPDLVGVGAGRGFGWEFGRSHNMGGALIDPGGVIGSLLDLPSALALAATSKAAFLGSRQPWENEVRKLADLLAPTATLNAVSDHLSHLIAAKTIFGSLPAPSESQDLLPKVMAMFKAGLPVDAIGQAIGRRMLTQLETEPASAVHFVQALAYIGAIPPLQWLKEGHDIDVAPRPMEQITA